MDKKNKLVKKSLSNPKVLSLNQGMMIRYNLWWLGISMMVSLLIFFLIRHFYPHPVFYPDSYTYVQAAKDNSVVSYRPVEYSNIIRYFKTLSDSDFALIFFQCMGIQFANAFFYLTINFIFKLSKIASAVYFLFIICNPFFVLLGNMVLSDAFFATITLLWFSILLWILYKPSWWLFIISTILLVLAFKIRYQAIIFPIILTLFIFFIRIEFWKKFLFIGINYILIFIFIKSTESKVEESTGVKTFSAFSGWQLACNVMHIYYNDRSVNYSTQNEETDDVASFMKNFLDTSTTEKPFQGISSDLMWNPNSALKKYLYYYIQKNNTNYFTAWNELGPIYSDFSKKIILKNPDKYFRHFVLPNSKVYFNCQLEALGVYKNSNDSLPKIVKDYYGYDENFKQTQNHPWFYDYFIQPWKIVFPLLNVCFLLFSITYLLLRKFKNKLLLFDRSLIFTYVFIISNIGFIVLLAPVTFRYVIYLIPILFGFCFLIGNQIMEIIGKKIKFEPLA